MKLRDTKRMCKRCMRSFNPPLKITKTIKRLFIVEPRHNFVCMRWYAFVVSSADNPYLQELINEQEEN